MTPSKAATTPARALAMCGAFIARNWRFLVCFALALHVGLVMASTLNRANFSVNICHGLWGCGAMD